MTADALLNRLEAECRPLCDGRHTRKPPARYAITLHASVNDDCRNRVSLCCGPCYTKLKRETQEFLDRLNRPGSRPACLACGCPLSELSDVIRDEVAL